MNYPGELKTQESGLCIDLYELTMAQACYSEQLEDRALFTLHFRKQPGYRNFRLACGQHYAALPATALRFPPNSRSTWHPLMSSQMTSFSGLAIFASPVAFGSFLRSRRCSPTSHYWKRERL